MNWFIQTLLYGRTLPRVIKPRTHAVLDWLVTAYFMTLAGANWGKNNRAAATALINGGAVLGLALLTDYDGDGRRPISFETHGKIDLLQAGMASGLPIALGFANQASAVPLEAQALNELVVVASTDWEANSSEYREEYRAA